LLVRNRCGQRGGDLSGVVPEAADPFGVPEMMQIAGPEPIYGDPLSSSTSIVIIGGVEGLMEVADQMEDEFQPDQSFFGISFGVGRTDSLQR